MKYIFKIQEQKDESIKVLAANFTSAEDAYKYTEKLEKYFPNSKYQILRELVH